MVPGLDGAYFSELQKETLWDKFFRAATSGFKVNAILIMCVLAIFISGEIVYCELVFLQEIRSPLDGRLETEAYLIPFHRSSLGALATCDPQEVKFLRERGIGLFPRYLPQNSLRLYAMGRFQHQPSDSGIVHKPRYYHCRFPVSHELTHCEAHDVRSPRQW